MGSVHVLVAAGVHVVVAAMILVGLAGPARAAFISDNHRVQASRDTDLSIGKGAFTNATRTPYDHLRNIFRISDEAGGEESASTHREIRSPFFVHIDHWELESAGKVDIYVHVRPGGRNDQVVTPEPSTGLLVAGGLVAIAAARRKRSEAGS